MAQGTWSNPVGALGGGKPSTGDLSAFSSKTGQSFWSPGMATIADAAIKIGTQYFAGQVSKYNIRSQNAQAKTKYWREWASTESANWRNYEVQMNNYYNNRTWNETRRQYESMKQELQAGYKGEVALAAMQDFERQMSDIEGRFYEEEAKEIIELQGIRRKLHAEGVKKIASGAVGNSAEAIQSAKDQMWLVNLSNRQITRDFRLADKQRALTAADASRQQTVNQVRYYVPQQFQDPVKPLSPLPVEGYEPTPQKPVSDLTIGVGMAETAFNSYLNYLDQQPGTKDMSPNQPIGK